VTVSALALPLVASLAALATADVQVDLRAEARTTVLEAPGSAPLTREGLLARPGAAIAIDVTPLRLTCGYAATVWTSDVAATPSPLVTQDARLRLETFHSRPWRAAVEASAARGWTDPLADPVQALAQRGLSQSPSVEPTEFEAARAGASGSYAFDTRTAVDVEAVAARSQAANAEDLGILPRQDTFAGQLSVGRLLSARTALRLGVGAAQSRTELPAGLDDARWLAASARFQVRVSRPLSAWAGAGAMVTRHESPDRSERTAHPIGEVGVAYARASAEADASAQAVPFTDRFNGDVSVMYQGTAALSWSESARLSFSVSGSAGALPSGDTALAALDVHGRYALGERLAAVAGIVGRWQRERRDDAASYAEIGLVVAMTWQTIARGGASAPPGAGRPSP
jgi:hypothetical protein